MNIMTLSPLKACPPQGGPTNLHRKRSAMENRSKKRRTGNGPTTTMRNYLLSDAADPISFTSSSTKCSFCKMKKHTVNHCPRLLKYGQLLLLTEDRAELGREIHNPAFYVNKPKPAGEQKTVVNCNVPRSATCVVVQQCFILLRDIHINSPTIMHVKCTILDDAARPMEEYTDAIFTPDAIMSYVSSGRKKIVNQLQKAAATVHQTESISK